MASMLETSRLYQFGKQANDRLAGFVRGSYLYRWLTAEPEPEVIVIDLRETWTVGPVIKLLDWVIGYVERAADGSGVVAGFEGLFGQTLKTPLSMAGRGLVVLAVFAGLAVAVSRSIAILGVAVLCGIGGLVVFQDNRSWAELKQTRAVELVIATFEPPAPPEERQLQGGESTDEHQAVQPNTGEPEEDPLNES